MFYVNTLGLKAVVCSINICMLFLSLSNVFRWRVYFLNSIHDSDKFKIKIYKSKKGN